jgi:adenylate cyclase
MNNYSFFIFRNSMLAGNIVANLVGMLLFTMIENFTVAPSTEQADLILAQIRHIYFPCAYLIMIILTIYYEKPIRSFLKGTQNRENIDLALKGKARQRVLNEPFFLLLLDFSVWVVSALLFPLILWGNGITGKILFRLFCQKFLIGVIITTCAFFLLEMILRKKLIPIFFPEGGLYKTPRTFRIRIKTRLTALLVGINIIPLTAFFIMGMATYSKQFNETELLLRFRIAVLFNVLGFMILGILLVFLVTSSMSKPFGDIIKKLKQIKKGKFDGKIMVLSNDEIGYTAEVINDMAEGLKDREFIKDAFGKYVAKEVRDEVLSGNIPLDGEQKKVTVLFTDLRNFTPMVEKYEPKQTIQMMNMYFKEMAKAIQENGGLVLQLIGDEI